MITDYRIFLVCLVFILNSILSAQPSYEHYSMVWSDEFDGSGLVDSKNWGYEEGYVRNKELQYYTKARLENARMEDGNLIIEARRDNWDGNEYTAASLHTRGKKEFQYGIFEIRARIDIRKGSWPAFWTLGVSEEWPSNGEIDIMEYYNGNLHANVAWGTNTRWQAKWDSQTKPVDSEFAKDFHIWRMLWTENKIELYVDDFLQNSTDLSTTINGNLATLRNPFHQKAYIMINQAIGSNGGDPSLTEFPVKYIIDYVRVYQESNDTTAPYIVDATASIDGNIYILFSEEVDKASAETLSSYSTETHGAQLTSAELLDDKKTVAIFYVSPGILREINISVQGIKDDAASGNVLSKKDITVKVGPLSRKLTGKLIGNGTPYNDNSRVGYSAAVDGDTATYSDCVGEESWVGYDFGNDSMAVITGVRFYPRDGYLDRMSGRSIEVSINGDTWTKIHTFQTPGDCKYYLIPVVYSKPVKYVRYNGTGGYLNVSEIEFMGYFQKGTSVSSGRRVNWVKCEQWLSGSPVLCSRYNMTGQIIDSRVVSGYKNVNHLLYSLKSDIIAGGIYLVKLEDVSSKKIIYQGVTNLQNY